MHMWFVIFLIVGAIVGYANDRIPMEITSIVLISTLLVFFHFFPLADADGTIGLSTEKLLSGFANPALISVLLLLVLGQTVVQTGALNEMANFILRITKNNAFLSISITLFFVMIVSAILNNTPVVIIFIPIMASLAKGVNISVSRVMIPLSFVSILGGMMTLIGSSTNLLVSGILGEMGYDQLSFFDFTLPGFFMAMIGFLYIIFFVPKILPDRASLVKNFAGGDDDSRKFIAQVEMDYSSDFIGRKLSDGKFSDFPDIAIKMIQRGEHAFLPPFDDDLVIRPRDIIIMASSKKELGKFFSQHPDSIDRHFASLGDVTSDSEDSDIMEDVIMAEIVVSPASKMVGHTLHQTGFHREYNCVVLGVQRQSRNIRARVTEIRLAPGDVLLIMGKREDILSLHEGQDFLLMEWSTEEIHSGSKAGITAIIFACVVGLAAIGVVPIAVSAFAGVAATLLFRCINLRQAGRALDMKIILMIGASLALGAALQKTGGASFLAHSMIDLMNLIDGTSPIMVMSALFLFMMGFTNLLSNNASAVLFTPIAVNLAVQLNVDPMMFIFAVIFACNCSFATPIGYQTNLMVMGPGHYKFSDFVRSGIPLALIVWLSYTAFAYFYF